MEIIVFQNELYTLYPVNYNFDFSKWNFYHYCDMIREALSTLDIKKNKWVMDNGSGVWFGCIGR